MLDAEGFGVALAPRLEEELFGSDDAEADDSPFTTPQRKLIHRNASSPSQPMSSQDPAEAPRAPPPSPVPSNLSTATTLPLAHSPYVPPGAGPMDVETEVQGPQVASPAAPEPEGNPGQAPGPPWKPPTEAAAWWRNWRKP